MLYYKRTPEVVDAITFDQFVQYGIDNGGNIVNGMPWHFEYKGCPVTHCNDNCYLICTQGGEVLFWREDVLIAGVNGGIYTCKKDIFEQTYEPVK